MGGMMAGGGSMYAWVIVLMRTSPTRHLRREVVDGEPATPVPCLAG
jgi:HAMP domain-containing protein